MKTYIKFNDMFSPFSKMGEMMNDMCKTFGSWDSNENTFTFTLKSGKTVKISEVNDNVNVTVDGKPIQCDYTYNYYHTANNPPKSDITENVKEDIDEKDNIETILRRIEMTISVMSSEQSKGRWSFLIIGILNLLMLVLLFATIICN